MVNTQQTLAQVVFIPSPGMGHIIPMVELAKKFVSHHNIGVTFLIPTLFPPSEAQESLLQTLPPKISHVSLPQADMGSLSPKNTKMHILIILSVVKSLDFIRKELQLMVDSGSRLTAVVADLFAVDCIDVAKEFNAAPYIFFWSSAMVVSTFYYLPKLHEMVDCEYRELDHPIEVPGCRPIPALDLFDSLQDRKDEAYKWMLHFAKKYHQADGLIVNSFMELENGPLKALQDPQAEYPPVYAVGPLVSSDGVGKDNKECMDWLDGQPPASVLYVSFGSAGNLTVEQITELAFGLEMSGQRFLWVTRKPVDKKAEMAVDETDRFDFLPEGFLDRTKDRGLIVDSWAPQQKILCHGSTGGHLTHSGWNSGLESIVNGVPLIAWPMFAEQKMNAFLMTEDAGIALRPRRCPETGLIGREEISKVVANLMEGDVGKAVRERMNCLKIAAAKALSEDGASDKTVAQVVSEFKIENPMKLPKDSN